MESFLNDIHGIHADIVEAEQNADKLIAVTNNNLIEFCHNINNAWSHGQR